MILEEEIDEFLEHGIKLHRAGSILEAKEYYQKVLNKSPNNSDALNLLGVASLHLGDTELAVSLITKALVNSPNNPGFLNNLGQAFQDLGEGITAITHFQNALKVSPENTEVLNNLGITLTNLERYEEADEIFKKATALEDNNPDLFHNYATMFQESRQLELSIEHYQNALNLDPNRPSTHGSLASAFEELGERDQALHHYWLAIKLDPFHLDTHLAIKKLRWAENNEKNIHESFFYVCKSFPSSAEALFNLASSLFESNDLKEAETYIKKAIDLSNKNPRFFHLLATIYHAQKKYKQAIQAHEKCLSLDKRNPLYLERYGSTLTAAKDYDRAFNELIAAHKLHPRRSGILGALTIVTAEINSSEINQFVDYEKFVSTRKIRTPRGFNELADFNNALHEEISVHHDERPPPLGQTMRGGTQIPNNLFKSAKGLTAVLKESLSEALKEYINKIDVDISHPFLRFKNADFRYTGAWSTILHGSGYDMSHLHEGWISGVYYIKVPDISEESWNRGEGCIQFGEPPTRFVSSNNKTRRLIKPEEGLAVFFPSYYWHGVRPFQSEGLRHAIAFDII
ncbi:MAG: tetratricopeptide repeat protein [Alphaproteobacteria bacterium]